MNFPPNGARHRAISYNDIVFQKYIHTKPAGLELEITHAQNPLAICKS